MTSLLWLYFWYRVAKYMAGHWTTEQHRNRLRSSLATKGPKRQPCKVLQFRPAPRPPRDSLIV